LFAWSNKTCYFIGMEKRRSHYPLDLVQKLAADPSTTRFTRIALNEAAELGYNMANMRKVIMSLWQDVYRPVSGGVQLYVKLTVYAEKNLLVVSFKRR